MSIIMKASVFLIYSLSTRFDIGNYIKIVIKGFTILIVGYFLFSLRGTSNLLNRAIEVLNDGFFSSIPVISWAKEVFMAPIVPGTPILQTLALLFTAILVLFLAVYLATNYYEEAAAGAEYISKIKASRNKSEDLQKVIEERKGKSESKELTLKSIENLKAQGLSFGNRQLLIKEKMAMYF